MYRSHRLDRPAETVQRSGLFDPDASVRDEVVVGDSGCQRLPPTMPGSQDVQERRHDRPRSAVTFAVSPGAADGDVVQDADEEAEEDDPNLRMAELIPLVYDRLPTNFCPRQPAAPDSDEELWLSTPYAERNRPKIDRQYLPQSNQVLRALLVHGGALRGDGKPISRKKPLAIPSSQALSHHFKVHKFGAANPSQHLSYPEAEYLPAVCRMDARTPLPAPLKFCVPRRQYEEDEEIQRAGVRAASHAETFLASVTGYVEEAAASLAATNPADLSSLQDELRTSLRLIRKCAIFMTQAIHWQVRGICNSMLHRRDAYLDVACGVTEAERAELRSVPFHEAKGSLFGGKVATIAPSLVVAKPKTPPQRLSQQAPQKHFGGQAQQPKKSFGEQPFRGKGPFRGGKGQGKNRNKGPQQRRSRSRTPERARQPNKSKSFSGAKRRDY